MPNLNNQMMRGRIHQGSNDVLNGVSGMEHLSNSLIDRKGNKAESPAILAQMRSGGQYVHHSSQPEKAIMEQLQNMNSGDRSPVHRTIDAGIPSSNSRIGIANKPELDYDPFYTNQ